MKFKFNFKSTALLGFVALNSATSISFAAPGSLDLSFGGTGRVKTGFGGGYAAASAAAVQADGKLLLAGYGNGQVPSAGGDFLIARFDTNNLLDVLFGEGGKIATKMSTNVPSYSSESSSVQALRVQGDGKIVAAGFAYRNSSYSDFALARYNSDGSLDTTFGSNGTGTVFTDFGEQSQINAMQIEGDGKIVVAGFIANTNDTTGFALARYDTNGVLDASFGTGGTTITSGANDYTRANALMIQSDGKFVAVGTGIASGDGGVDIAVFRYTTNGILDTTFNGTGLVFTRISPTAFDYWDSANAVATQSGSLIVQNPDKIVVAGSYEDENVSPSQFYLALIRYNLDGTLDSTFGTGGIVTKPISKWFSYPAGLAVQGFLTQPRKITVGGYVNDFTNIYYFLYRFNAAGALDTTFGTNSSGTVTFPLGRDVDIEATATAMTLQSGEFVLAGYRAIPEGESDFAAVRFTSSGLVDTTFGTNGLLLANVSDALSQATAVAVQNDGKIVAAGYALSGQYNPVDRFAVARFNADGSLDTSFGQNGKLITSITTNDQAYALAIQPDGKIIAAGSSYSLFALARYNPDGSLDNSFGVNGTTTTVVGTGSGQINALRLQPDGRILAAGSADDASGNVHFALARFNTNGTLDATFGGGGKVITTISTADIAYGAGVQVDGKIVLAGLAASISGAALTANFAAARYNTNGAADFSFGSLGRAQGNAGGGTLDVAYAMAIQPDGKIVVAGGAGLGNLPGPVGGNASVNSFVALMRFNTNGTPDTSFGNSGYVITEVGAYSDFATSLALQPDGKILVAGASQNGFYKFFALRYNPDGSVDNSYGAGGAAMADFGSGTNEIAYAMALDSSGRAVLAGDAGGIFGVARLQGDFVISPSLKIVFTATNAVVVSWPFPSSGWNLQQNASLTSTSWSAPSEMINTDGTNNFIVVSPPGGDRFYRLSQP